MKIAVAAPAYGRTLAECLSTVGRLAGQAAAAGAAIVCFPESYLPGYPAEGEAREQVTEAQLREALNEACGLAKAHHIAIILPMDWYEEGVFLNVAQVIGRDGRLMGYQTKNQLDPSEDDIWEPGTSRQVFEVGGLKFGIVICHEGFRYPESVRLLARKGAQLVFHPNYTGSSTQGQMPTEWGQKDSPYYEKAQMVRALENTIYFATSNYALPFPESASAIIAPDGSCLAWQPYGEEGVAVAEIDSTKATGLLAGRLKPELYSS